MGHLPGEETLQFPYWKEGLSRVHGGAVQCDNPITLTYHQS